MTPDWYVNLRVRAAVSDGGHGLAQTAGPGALANSVMGRLVNVVHAISSAHQFEFAAAFPLARVGEHAHPGNLLRVFLTSREHADSLLEALESHEFLMGYVHLDRPRKVLATVDGSVSYQLLRIASRKNRNSITRQRQLERGNTLPYIRMTSSSGESFSLRFDIVKREQAADANGKTNGYGLSTRSSPLYLPDFPAEAAPWAAVARGEQKSFQ